MRGTVHVRAFSVLLAVVLWVGSAEGGQSNRPLAILDVPFISQSEALCGGAAAAMVMRYWGARGLDAGSFAHLVDRSAAGIRTTALVDDIRRRGWSATAIAGSDEAIARELADGRPILTLIQDRPGTFHYIVIIGATQRAVVYHDPARTAFRTMSREEFDRRWSAADRWMALVVPPVAAESRAATPGTPSEPDAAFEINSAASCDALISDGVRLAQSNDLDGAERRLTGALSCEGPAPLRELAGVRLLQRRWGEVSDLASAALAEDPSDAHAWRLLATSRFVQDDRDGALNAWNHVGEPRVDLIRVDGLVRTRQRIVEQLLPIERNDVLTPARFVRARRQLRELPSAASAELTFVPVPSGLAELRATVAERALIPADRWSLAALGVVAALRREVEVSSGALTGGGERITVGWRFWPDRPRVSAAFTSPAPWGGLWTVDAFGERQPFTDLFATSRRHGAHLSMSEWVAPRMRASIRGGVEQWDGVDTFGMLSAALRVLTVGERFDGRVELSGWKAGSSFGTMDVGATIRSTTERRGQVFVGRAGLGLASVDTPADIWFAGDTGRARGMPLRAHPLMTGGQIRVDQIGRQVIYSSGETQRWWPGKAGVRFGAAAFVDAAHTDRRTVDRARTDVDLGIGVRLAVPGVSGTIRIDVAKGLRDGATAVSFVYDP
ncbi:MAG TPA: papain-like cysteine protease family protein [Vicinamibacterales bacterium]